MIRGLVVLGLLAMARGGVSAKESPNRGHEKEENRACRLQAGAPIVVDNSAPCGRSAGCTTSSPCCSLKEAAAVADGCNTVEHEIHMVGTGCSYGWIDMSGAEAILVGVPGAAAVALVHRLTMNHSRVELRGVQVDKIECSGSLYFDNTVSHGDIIIGKPCIFEDWRLHGHRGSVK